MGFRNVFVICIMSLRFLQPVLGQYPELLPKDIFPLRTPVFSHPRSASDLHEWSYSGGNGPSSWPNRFVACGGNHQSPVNIDTDMTEKDDSLGALTFVGYETPLTEMILENNGHTVSLKTNGERIPGIRDGGLKGFFAFSQLHFHWGNIQARGSEHTVDESRFPIEMHMVHNNNEQTTEGEAGIAVLSVLFETTLENNANLNPIVLFFNNVTFKDTEVEIARSIKLFSLLPHKLGHFYRYVGSLTTPPCTEGVEWTIFAETVPIGIEQLEVFRTLRSTTQDSKTQRLLINNFRPLQKLKGRKILEVGNTENFSH